MIPSNTQPVDQYVGNDLASVFAITYPTFEDDNIIASVIDVNDVETPLVINTDYTLASIGIPNTDGELTLVDNGQAWINGGNLATGYDLRIKFNPDAFQPSKMRDQGRFAPEVIEKALDRLTMCILAIRQQVTYDFQSIDVSALQAEIDAAEVDILALQNDMSTAQSDISSLQAADVLLDSRVDDLETDMTAAQGDILALQAVDISLDSRIDDLENAQLVLEARAANFNAAYNDLYVCSNNISAQLPAPMVNGVIRFKVVGSNNLTLVRNGAENIDGVAADLILSSEKEAVTIISDGTDWFLI